MRDSGKGSVNPQQRGKWTPSLVIRTIIYLTVVTLVLVSMPEVRHGIGYLITQIGTVVCFGAGILLALFIMLGSKTPRR